jgi:transcriptional regulator with XRE-family HTH domain
MPGTGRRRALSVEEAFGQTLRDYRLERGVSQEQLGFELDSGRTYVSELERGQRAPTLRWLFRVARWLGVRPSEIIGRVEELTGDRGYGD